MHAPLPRNAVLPPWHPFGGLREHGYSATLADPPWRFRTWSETNQSKSASRYYKLMEMPEIKARPVVDLAAKDCVLFLWAIDAMLPQIIAVGEAWGFIYKTMAFVWAKQCANGSFPIGTGY